MSWFWLALLSAALSAAAAITQKKVLFRMEALDFSWLLSLLTLLLSLPLFALVDYSRVTPEALFVLFGKNILGALAFYCVMQSIRRLELSSALPMMTLTPGIVAVAAWPLLGEALRGMELLGMLLLLVGTYLMEMVKGKSIWHPFSVYLRSPHHKYITAALLLFAATSILDKVLLTDLRMGPVPLVAFQHAFNVLVFAAFMLIMRRPLRPARAVVAPVLPWIALVGVMTLGYRFAQVEAVALAPVALVLAVKRTSVFMAAMVGGSLFEESALARKAVAIVLLLAGALCIVGL